MCVREEGISVRMEYLGLSIHKMMNYSPVSSPSDRMPTGLIYCRVIYSLLHKIKNINRITGGE
jgi:hypothetical protein